MALVAAGVVLLVALGVLYAVVRMSYSVMVVSIKKTRPEAVVPRYATRGAACFDLHAAGLPEEGCVIEAGDPITIPTGLAFEIPEGFVMNVYSRSGHGFNHDIRLANCVGKIDSDYRGEVVVKLAQDASKTLPPLRVRNGDRVAQAEIVPVDQVTFELADELSVTARGVGGFGSTGT